MKKIQLIYNPYAGVREFPKLLDFSLDLFNSRGYELHLFRTSHPDEFSNLINRNDGHNFEAILVAGGDGSVNLAVNALLRSGRDIPLGIIPAGTSNDLARHLKIPMDLSAALKSLTDMNTELVDVGLVNNTFFVNVCSGGLLTNIAHDVTLRLKNVFGRMAYYMKGVKELPRFSSMRLRIVTPESVMEDEFYLFLVLNGSGAGGFEKLGGPASIVDGKLDFMGIKPLQINELLAIFRKILRGEHITDRNVVYFQFSSMRIERLEGDQHNPATDVDGEKGPDYPLSISILPRRLRLVVPPTPIC